MEAHYRLPLTPPAERTMALLREAVKPFPGPGTPPASTTALPRRPAPGAGVDTGEPCLHSLH